MWYGSRDPFLPTQVWTWKNSPQQANHCLVWSIELVDGKGLLTSSVVVTTV